MQTHIATVFRLGVITVAALVASLAVAQSPRQVPPVPKQSAQPSRGSGGKSLNSTDREFMKKAAEGGMKEVEMGRMAEQQGKSSEVKAFGRRMVTDHSKANNELMAIAGKKGVQLSHKAPKLQKMGGDNFDKEYLASMVKDHEEDLAEFQREASSGSDSDLKAFASKTAKVIQKHLDLAKADQGKLK